VFLKDIFIAIGAFPDVPVFTHDHDLAAVLLNYPNT
jgi:hypothetical protein